MVTSRSSSKRSTRSPTSSQAPNSSLKSSSITNISTRLLQLMEAWRQVSNATTRACPAARTTLMTASLVRMDKVRKSSCSLIVSLARGRARRSVILATLLTGLYPSSACPVTPAARHADKVVSKMIERCVTHAPRASHISGSMRPVALVRALVVQEVHMSTLVTDAVAVWITVKFALPRHLV